MAVALVIIFLVTRNDKDQDQQSAMVEQGEQTPATAQPADDVTLIKPSFDVVRISRGGTGVIAGRATPGSVVEIYADSQLVGTVTADANGEWVMILERPLARGPSELSLLSHSEGEISAESSDVVVVSVPESEAERFVESDSNGVVAILTPRDGIGASRVLQKPGSSPVGEIGDSLSLDTIDYDESGRAVISGRAVPRAQIAVYLDNDFMGAGRADDEGYWSLFPESAISEGLHVMRIDQVIGEGDVQLRIEQPFETGMPIDASLREGKVVVQPGNSLWHIARRIYGAGIRYTFIFQENADQIRDPDLIYPGQLFSLPAAVENP